MGEYVYYLGIRKSSLKTIKYKVIKERNDISDKNKKALYSPRNDYKVKRNSWPGLRGGLFCLEAECLEGLEGPSFPSQSLLRSQVQEEANEHQRVSTPYRSSSSESYNQEITQVLVIRASSKQAEQGT